MIEFLSSILYYDEEYAHEALMSCLSVIERCFDLNFLDVLVQLGFEFRLHFMGERLFERKASKLEKRTSQSLVSIISPEMIISCIQNGGPRAWDTLHGFAYYIQLYDENKWNSAIDKIVFSDLDFHNNDLWATQPDELLKLFSILHTRLEEVGCWIYDHRDDIDSMRTMTIVFSPKTAEYLYAKNKPVMLIDASRHWWKISVRALIALKKYCAETCHAIVQYNDSSIRSSLLNLNPTDWDEYFIFFKYLAENEKEYTIDMLDSLDSDILYKNWTDKAISDRYSNYNKEKRHAKGFRKLIQTIYSVSNNKRLLNAISDVENNLISIINSPQQ